MLRNIMKKLPPTLRSLLLAKVRGGPCIVKPNQNTFFRVFSSSQETSSPSNVHPPPSNTSTNASTIVTVKTTTTTVKSSCGNLKLTAEQLQLKAEIEKEEKDSIAWARTSKARQVLESVHSEAEGLIIPSSLEDYLRKRKISVEESPEGLRIASSLLTYPLTLAYALRRLLPGQRATLSALVVGARAESQLPLHWWREALVTCEKTMALNLKFAGPESCSKLLYNKEVYQASIPWNMGRCDSGREVTVYSDKSMQRPLHEVDTAAAKGLLLDADVFVLFNPGFGNLSLKARWHDTMKTLMATKKPIVCTANSPADLRRDLDALAALADEEDHMDLGDPIEMLLHPQDNPYFSRRRAFDGFEVPGGEDVRTNQFLYIFQMK